MKADADPSEFTTSLRSLWIAGFCLVLAFFGAIGAWSVLTVMTGAVVSQGQFVVDGNVKKVQHPTGGVVGELVVHDGTRVEQGAVLIRLDVTAK